MTIRLIDIEDQKQLRDEQETFNLRVKDLLDNPDPSREWPKSPKLPEPMVDSRDKGALPNNDYGMATPTGGFNGGKTDPCSYDPLDFDGTSQSEVKGHESVWQFNANDGELESSDASPFKLKR